MARIVHHKKEHLIMIISYVNIQFSEISYNFHSVIV